MDDSIILKFEDYHVHLERKDKKPIGPDEQIIIQLPGCFLGADNLPLEIDPDYFDGGIDF